jgi:DNA gyrase subunit A
MSVVRDGAYVFTVTDGGFAKRTPVDQYRLQNRSGLGIKAMKLVDERGALAGALVVDETDEVLAVTSNGGVIRSRVDEVNPTGRDTMGVRYMNLADGDLVLGIARNAEADEPDVEGDLEIAGEAAEGVATDAGIGGDATDAADQAEGSGESSE